MKDRRTWLKQASLGIVGLGLGQINAFASPTPEYLNPVPDEIPIRLNLNENPYGPPPMAITAMLEELKLSNRYHWRQTTKLVSAIAKKNDVDIDNILMGAGASELLDLVFRLTALQKGSFILSEPTYDKWADTAPMLGYQKIKIPLTSDKRHDLSAMLNAIKPDTRLIYICNPNNPAGTICERDALKTFINKATKKVLVLIDEAYLDFTNQQTLANYAIKNENLVVTRTFSKIYGLAGARIGYAIAHPETIHQLRQLQAWPPKSVSVVSVAGATASLMDEQFVKETYALNKKARTFTIEQLERLNSTCIASHTNFIYFSLANYKKDYFKQLENNNILGSEIYEAQGKWTRITVGTMQEMEMFIKALE